MPWRMGLVGRRTNERTNPVTAATISAQQVAEGYANAWTSGDIDTAMSYIADDIVCEAPAGTIEGKAAYREFTTTFVSRLLVTGRVTAVLADDSSAAILYTNDTRVVQGMRAMDYATVENGKITRLVTVFDRLPFGR
jgi:hypothetical protein